MVSVSFSLLIFAILLILVGALLHGMSGVGFPMISTMATAMIFPLPLAIALMVFPNILINIMVLEPFSFRKNKLSQIFDICLPYRPLVLSCIIGCVLGVLLLKHLSSGILYSLLAIATLFYIFYSLLSSNMALKIKQDHFKLRMLVFGFLAGLIGGATNAMSSILMIFLLNATNEKNTIVIVSNVCFLLAKIVQLVLLQHSFATLTWSQIIGVIFLSFFSLLILQLGIKIRHKISVQFFKKLVLLVLLGLSLNALRMSYL